MEKHPDAGKDWGQEKRVTEDEMVGWHHRFHGHELGQTLGDGEGQGGLVCCSPWGCRVGLKLATEPQLFLLQRLCVCRSFYLACLPLALQTSAWPSLSAPFRSIQMTL